MKRIARWVGIGLIAALAVIVASQTASAQDDGGGRKVKQRVAPVYPELARKLNVSGTVKVEITVLPNGNVKNVKALGGHPVLIEAASDAARKWKFEPAHDETTTVVQFNFSPSS
jgi:TonB family protein